MTWVKKCKVKKQIPNNIFDVSVCRASLWHANIKHSIKYLKVVFSIVHKRTS